MRIALQLAISIAVCLGAGGLSVAGMSRESFEWYQGLRRPAFTPPSSVFAPVWGALYLMMGVALFIIWRCADAGVDVRVPVALFVAQLSLNALWTPAFFGLRSPAAGLAVILPLWALILVTMAAFWQVTPLAGALLIPYAAWTAFAALLNASILAMNR